MDRLAVGMGFMDLDQELAKADVESVSSDNTVASGSNGNVQVVVRVRPPSSREREQGYIKCVGVDSTAHSVSLNFRPQPRTFTFDYLADECVGQEEVFTSVGKPITDACLQGYHCCLIAYGQTGAGKTFTMEGPDSDSSSGGSPGFLAKANLKRHEKRGLIPRILDYIFQRMAAEKIQNCKDVEFVVKCSYLQIYNEQVSDLLDPGSYNLTIHEDAKAGMYVEGLQEVVVSTAEATYGVFRRGSENRHVGMTAMNLESSRSHSVFTVVVESQRRNDGGVMNRRTSRFYLVDLAGSERQKHSESAGIRLKEAGSINKSLSALGNVIKALVDISEGKIRHVPYRDSKLTFLLKDALGGNSKCTLIANVSPAEKNIDETLSTLKFAQRAKLIHNTAIVNEDMFGNPAVMGEEIRRLRLEIAALRANVGSGMGGDQSSMSGQETQSESARTSRLEHIISQSVKRSLEAERKNETEMHALELKLQATQAMCERLEKTLQSQKMIIRLRENTIKRLESGRPSLQPEEFAHDAREEIEQLRKQIEHHPDVVRFKMELDLCRGQLDEYEEERKDEELLSQIAQLENLNQTLKIEFQEMVEEKAMTAKEFDEVKSSRDMGMNQLTTFEEQFIMLRDAVEKYRIEAAEALHKQEKAEEKLQECTREQDEVWRRSNLAEAQATEYAQELTALRSQAEKMNVAFSQQTRLQEDIFLELQKTTDELENSRHTVASLQHKLDDADAVRVQMDFQLSQAEEERSKTTRLLEEMITAREQLAATLKERDETHAVLTRKLEQADQNAKLLDEKLSAISSLDKVKAEELRDAAVRHKEELLKALSEQSAEKERALEELRSLSSQKLEELRNEMDSEVQQISTVLKSKLAQLDDMEKLSSQHADALTEKENIRKAVQVEADELRHQLEQINTEVLAHKVEIRDTSSRLESSNAQIISLLQERETLQIKAMELEQMSTALSAAMLEREEAQKRLSETEVNLDALSAENETLKYAMKEADSKLLEMNTSFDSLKGEYDALDVENQNIRSLLTNKSQEVEAVSHQKSILDACLSEELLRTAAAEQHVKDLTEKINALQADVAVMESLKSDVLEKTREVELLEKRATKELNHVVAENGSQVAHEGCNQVLETVKSGEDGKNLLGKISDLEVASTAMLGIIHRLEEEKSSFQTSIAALQRETGNAKAEEAVLKCLVRDKEEALLIKSEDLEDLKSQLQLKAEEMQKLEVQLLDQSHQVEAAAKVHQALEADHSQVVMSARALQNEKEGLSKSLAVMDLTLKTLESSIDSLKQEKVALQARLGSQFDLSERSTEEQVKDVDVSNHVIHGETQVCVDPGTNHIDHLLPRKGDLVSSNEVVNNHKYSDEKEEDRRPQEQETDGRLLAALADMIDLKSDVAGCETKVDLALKSYVQAQEQSLVAFSRARDLEVRLALVTDECGKLREELCKQNCRSATLESELEFCRGQEARYSHVGELEKELESSLYLLQSVTTALELKKSEEADFIRRIDELSSEQDVLSRELKQVKDAKSLVEAQLLSTEAKFVEVSSKTMDLDCELQLLRIGLEEALTDACDKGSRLEVQLERNDEIANKVGLAEARIFEEQGRVYQLEGIRSELEAQVELLVDEKGDVRDRLETVKELLAASRESEHLKDDLEQRFESLKAEKSKLVAELQVRVSDNGEMGKTIQELTQKFLFSEDRIAALQTCNLELSQSIECYTSRLFDLDVTLRKAVSDHEFELSALTCQIQDRELQLGELTEQNIKVAADLQELRDEVQYNLGEVEYEFQKHVIDTEARMVDLENQKNLVQMEALQLKTRWSAEHSKFATILSALEEQVVDLHGNAQTWVENYKSLKNETIKMEVLDARVKHLEKDLLAVQKLDSGGKEEMLRLNVGFTDQAKRTNPFSWNNSFGSSAKRAARPLQGAQGVSGIDSVPKEDFMPKFTAQQRKRMAVVSKERAGGKSKTSYANQNSLPSFRGLSESLPPSQGNRQQTSRSQTWQRNASKVAKSKNIPAPQIAAQAQARQPLRSLSNNIADETNRRSPVVMKSSYDLRSQEKIEEESTTSTEPLRNNKRRRLA